MEGDALPVPTFQRVMLFRRTGEASTRLIGWMPLKLDLAAWRLRFRAFRPRPSGEVGSSDHSRCPAKHKHPTHTQSPGTRPEHSLSGPWLLYFASAPPDRVGAAILHVFSEHAHPSLPDGLWGVEDVQVADEVLMTVRHLAGPALSDSTRLDSTRSERSSPNSWR